MLIVVSSKWNGLATVKQVKELVETVARANARSRCPSLYASGVVYREEPSEVEQILSWESVLEQGSGDCASLTAWRVGELLRMGEKPQVVVSWEEKDDVDMVHVYMRNRGIIEDPSSILGMVT
jgi:methyl coenzyme M reductase subunit C